MESQNILIEGHLNLQPNPNTQRFELRIESITNFSLDRRSIELEERRYRLSMLAFESKSEIIEFVEKLGCSLSSHMSILNRRHWDSAIYPEFKLPHALLIKAGLLIEIKKQDGRVILHT